jgi:hypothetical protein
VIACLVYVARTFSHSYLLPLLLTPHLCELCTLIFNLQARWLPTPSSPVGANSLMSSKFRSSSTLCLRRVFRARDMPPGRSVSHASSPSVRLSRDCSVGRRSILQAKRHDTLVKRLCDNFTGAVCSPARQKTKARIRLETGVVAVTAEAGEQQVWPCSSPPSRHWDLLFESISHNGR